MNPEILTQYSIDREVWDDIPVLLGVAAQAYIYRRVGPDATTEDVYVRIDSMKDGFYNFYHRIDLYTRPQLGKFAYGTDVTLMENGFDLSKDKNARIKMKFILDEQSGEVVLYGELIYLHETVQQVQENDALIDFIDPKMARLRNTMLN